VCVCVFVRTGACAGMYAIQVFLKSVYM